MLTKDFTRMAVSTVAMMVYVLLVLQLPIEPVWFIAVFVLITSPLLICGLILWNRKEAD